MARKTIEARILAALRRLSPQTVAQLHGPGVPGLASRRASEIAAAGEAMAMRGELIAFWREKSSSPWSMVRERVFSLPPGWTDNPETGKEARREDGPREARQARPPRVPKGDAAPIDRE